MDLSGHYNGLVHATHSLPRDPRAVSFKRCRGCPVWWRLLCTAGTASCKLLLHPALRCIRKGPAYPFITHTATQTMLRTHLLDVYFQFCKTHQEATVVFSPQSHHFIQHTNQQKLGIFCYHWVKNIPRALCCSLPGKTQKSLSHTHFQTAMSKQMWNQI